MRTTSNTAWSVDLRLRGSGLMVSALMMALTLPGCDRSAPSGGQETPLGLVAHSANPATTAVGGSKRTPEEQRDFDLLVQVTDAIEKRVARYGYSKLSTAEKTIYTVWWLEAEVNNGGFDQYFFNSAGDNARDVPEAFSRIGAPQTAALVRKAIALFPPPGPSPDRATRIQQLEGLPSRGQFESFDERFYKSPENLERLLAAFARTHRDELPDD
jgi:hypothetical protein